MPNTVDQFLNTNAHSDTNLIDLLEKYDPERHSLRLSQGIALFLRSMVGVRSPNTIEWYRRRLPTLLDVLGDVAVDTVTIHQLREWRATLTERTVRYAAHPTRPTMDGPLSPFTLHQHVRGARRFFRWLHEEGLIPSNPAVRLELPTLPQYRPRGIPKRHLLQLIAAAGNPRDEALIRFLADTACRVCGVVGLTLDDLDLGQNWALVHEKGRGGYGLARYVFFTDRTRRALVDYLAVRPDCHDQHVFIGNKNTPLTTSGVYQVLKRAARRAGIRHGYNPHNLRHGALRGMLNNGLSLPEVSQIAGHSSTKVTGDIYGVVSETRLRQRHRRYSWMRDC